MKFNWSGSLFISFPSFSFFCLIVFSTFSPGAPISQVPCVDDANVNMIYSEFLFLTVSVYELLFWLVLLQRNNSVCVKSKMSFFFLNTCFGLLAFFNSTMLLIVFVCFFFILTTIHNLAFVLNLLPVDHQTTLVP